MKWQTLHDNSQYRGQFKYSNNLSSFCPNRLTLQQSLIGRGVLPMFNSTYPMRLFSES